MEKIIYTLLTAVLFSLSANAQDSYETGMSEALKLWEENQPTEAVERFEEIGKTEGDRWLPYYYASEIKIIEALESSENEKKEKQLKEAETLLEKAKSLGGEDNVELMVLEAMLHTGYLTMNPMEYGPSLSPVIIEIYDTAARLAPENPRVALSRAEWNMGAAPYMGKDPSIYCGDVAASLPLFEAYEPSEPFAPDWGEERAKGIIEKYCGNLQKAGKE